MHNKKYEEIRIQIMKIIEETSKIIKYWEKRHQLLPVINQWFFSCILDILSNPIRKGYVQIDCKWLMNTYRKTEVKDVCFGNFLQWLSDPWSIMLILNRFPCWLEKRIWRYHISERPIFCYIWSRTWWRWEPIKYQNMGPLQVLIRTAISQWTNGPGGHLLPLLSISYRKK